MTQITRSIVPALAAALLVSGCGGAPPASAPVPAVATAPNEAAADERRPVEREPEVTLEERWRSPFAVSSAGRIGERPERRIAVIGVDPAIAEAVEALRGAGTDSATARRAAADRRDAEEPAEDAVGDADRPDAAAGDRRPDRSRADDRVADRGDGPDAAADTRREPLTHRVGPGDTLWGIARRYNVPIEAIRALNDLDDERVRIGQTLRIPNDD